MLKLFLFGLVALTSFSECVYPNGGKVSHQGFRELTIQWDEIADFNSSGTATQHLYEIVVKLADKPDYFIPASVTTLKHHPNITIKNLLIDAKIKIKIALKPTPASLDPADFSPEYDFSVKSSKQAGEVLVPGEVQNLNIQNVVNQTDGHGVIITWDDPANVQIASNENDKSVQYNIETCDYIPFTQKKSNCQLLTEVLRNVSTNSQSTQTRNDLYFSNLHPATNMEVLFRVTAVSLNGTKGPAKEKIERLDPSTKPAAPTNVNSMNVYADQLKLTWNQTVVPAVYYIQYNIVNDKTIIMRTASTTKKTNQVLIDGLKAETEFEFQVGTISGNGASPWSIKYTVTTTNETKPTDAPPPPSGGSMLTSSSLLFAFTLGMLFKLI